MAKRKASQLDPKPAPQQPVTAPPSSSLRVDPLFRKRDWLTFIITFSAVWIVYVATLAPEVTLEDSGELVTGSMYAGIPHPPGYPVWTIYSWLWTALVPVGNMAWRVALAEATAGALACALISLLVARGSSLLIGSLESLKTLTGKWETAICIVCGLAAGLLMGLDSFMWRESVAANRIAVSSVPWFMLVLLCLMRWLYAPQQHRYLYWALLLFGICFTTHQSLVVAALGIEVLIAAGKPALGRDIFLGNGIIYLLCNLHTLTAGTHLVGNIGAKSGLLLIFNLIGIGSLIACAWLALRTKALLTEWRPVLIMGLLWLLGAAFYFYMPVSCMTNPPMQWCYPRTVDGFFHALSRGQYEQPNPTDITHDPGRFVGQLGMLVSGVAESFTWIGLFIAVIPFISIKKFRQRERAWLIGLTATWLCLGVLLMILLNPTPERASADLVKVFFNASHTIVACLIGYGLALTAAYLAVHYEQFRRWGLTGGAMALVLALYNLLDRTGKHYFGPAGQIDLFDLPHWTARAFDTNQYGLPIFANLLLLVLTLAFLTTLLLYRRSSPVAIILGLFAILPLYSGLSHWFECDQRGHMFGYWFGHDMFKPPFKGADSKPLFPEMTRDAILFGGTDAGRFCPTYMVFCESFTPHNCQPAEDQTFDRRDVYVITQNALADPPYLNYIRAHYNRSAQIDPPFFSELCRTILKDNDYQTNLLARAAMPIDRALATFGDGVEKRRRINTSWFTERDFPAPISFASKLSPAPAQDNLSKYLYEHLSAPTQDIVCAQEDQKLLCKNLAKDLNHLLDDSPSKLSSSSFSSASSTVYTPDRFAHVTLSDRLTDFLHQNPQSHARIRLNRLLLEAAYPNEIAKSPGGLYPDREIYTPTIDDQQRAMQEYTLDVDRRTRLNQLRPGEEVHIVDNHIQVSGQVAVMSINALIAKVIFDKNPNHEFFVEESLPLEWMYPHLTPHGVIMKVNRQPLSSIPDDTLDRDHEFWKQYSRRLTGDVIDDDTSVEKVARWIEKTYVRYDFNGFSGDRKFIHDIDAQKSFSKLRSAIAGVYLWRFSPQCPPEYRPKTNAELQRLLKEANFACLQAFAFSPWSPEAVFHYVNLLLQTNRLDDALLVAETCLKLDPFNEQVRGLANNLRSARKH